MADNAGPLAALRAWLSTRTQVRPVVLRPIGPNNDHVQGAVPITVGQVVRNEPDAGLHLVNANAADAGRVGPGMTVDLNKLDSSAWARPGRHNIAFSRDTATGDAVIAAIENTGRKTMIAHRPTPNRTLVAPSGQAPWAGADFRTAPQGARGVITRTEFGNGGAGGDRTRFRLVPPTDAHNPPPAGAAVNQ
ncbi:MAG: hypothetical protein JWO67_15 [Streptosporangiaceae bacterium]|nr:hypothetical protein [Streptosporangiaceae bacterium]